MVLNWTGRGILVFLIFIVMVVVALIFTVTEIAVPYRLTINQSTALTITIAAALSAIVTFPIGRWVMKQPRQIRVTDPQTGQTRLMLSYDTLIWIDVTYWSLIFAAIAVIMAAVTFLV